MTHHIKNVKVSDITIGKRHRKDMGRLDELAASIKEEGLFQAISDACERDIGPSQC